MRIVLMSIAIAACGGDKTQDGKGATAGSGSGTKVAEPTGSSSGSAAKPDLPTGTARAGELVHGSDKAAMQGFQSRDLAVGGGYVYFTEQPRIDKNGLGKSVVRRKQTTDIAATPEDVFGPGRVFAIAADKDNLYVVGSNVVAKPHAGGEPKELAKGTWLDVVVGDKLLLLRSNDKLAVVPKAGGATDVVWQGKRAKHSIAAAGDKFYVIEQTPDSTSAPKRQIKVYEQGMYPRIVVDAPEVRYFVNVEGDHVYFTGKPDVAGPAQPLWRVNAAAATRTAEPVGDRTWGFGDYTIANGTLYGMVFDKTWRFGKVKLAGDAKPETLDDLKGFGAMVTAIGADDTHVYYLTDWNVFRAPL